MLATDPGTGLSRTHAWFCSAIARTRPTTGLRSTSRPSSLEDQRARDVTQTGIREITLPECRQHPIVESVESGIEKIIVGLERCSLETAFGLELGFERRSGIDLSRCSGLCDSSLEGSGFEPAVPPRRRRPWREIPRPTIVVSRDDLCLMTPSSLSVRHVELPFIGDQVVCLSHD